jgi:hypothetical protein
MTDDSMMRLKNYGYNGYNGGVTFSQVVWVIGG